MSEATIVYPNVSYGDWVRCNNCDKFMLIPVTLDKCPECGAVGCMSWASEDEDYHTVFPEQIDHIHISDTPLLSGECFEDH